MIMQRQLDKFDIEAENEGRHLRKQGRSTGQDNKRIRQSSDYNKKEFDKLFKK